MNQAMALIALKILVPFALLVILTGNNAIAKGRSDDVRVVVEPGALLSRSEISRAAVSSCQPKRGNKLLVRRVVAAEGMPAGLAEVEVLSGSCRGDRGWIGAHRLTSGN